MHKVINLIVLRESDFDLELDWSGEGEIKMNRKGIVIIVLFLLVVLPASAQIASAFDLDDGGGGGTGSGSTFHVVNTASESLTLSWYFETLLGCWQYTWMKVNVHELTLEYDWSIDGGKFTKYKIVFSFQWDTTWLSGMWGDVRLRWGDNALTDSWAHTYMLDVGELTNGQKVTVQGVLSDTYTSWTVPYFHIILSTNCGYLGMWYEMEARFKIYGPFETWYNYARIYRVENWAYFVSRALALSNLNFKCLTYDL